MTHHAYRKLVEDICGSAAIQAPPPSQAVFDLQVKGVNFSLYHCVDYAPGHAVMYADFGAIPTQQREAILLRLLQTNLYLFGVGNPMFTCNPDTQHALLAAMLPLQGASAAHTLTLLAGYADIAIEWRTRHFLTVAEQDGAPGALSRQLLNSTAGRLAQQFSRPA